MSLYGCDGCMELIPPEKARIHCEDCVGDHNVCANCYVMGVFTHLHEESHSIILVGKSGHHPRPPSLPRRQQAATNEVASLQQDDPIPANTEPAAQGGWQPLFHGSDPTPIMVAYLGIVFDSLNANGDGLLKPEEYSVFLNIHAYQAEGAAGKNKELPEHSEQDTEDFKLRSTFEYLGIQHNVQPRPRGSTKNYNGNLKSRSGGMMPMLTKSGFIRITTLEMLLDPSPGLIRINRFSQCFNIWRQWGDVPRSMVPDVPPSDLVASMEALKNHADAMTVARAQSRVNANAAKLGLRALGEANALRLLDPPGTRYYYR